MSALPSIQQDGDLVEQAIFQEPTFSGLFYTYADIWDKHLRTRRTSGSIYIAGEWERFSQHHYAAIIRAWGAWSQLSAIRSACESWSNSASDRLALHSSVLSFYVHCTAAIDNLMLCGRFLATEVLRESTPGSPTWWLDWEKIRQERNLDAHEGLRPISDLYGQPAIDAGLLEEGKTWAGGGQEPLPVDTWIDGVWQSALGCMARAWSDLRSMCDRTPSAPGSPAPPGGVRGHTTPPPASGVITDFSGQMPQ